ncbi:helix-turn-helix domain-containing protein [Aquimarina mytili]|nr:AraC family transcriptional regulator [Aquimarina mytili]
METYTLIHILSGKGGIEVDFKNYYDWKDKVIYLEKGQYIKFQSENFVIRKIEFPSQEKFQNSEIRVLFKHLISLGYINLMECDDCQQYLSKTVFSDHTSTILDISSKQWFWQNPFHASKDEYQIIFDIKDVIDKEFSNHLSNQELVSFINSKGYNAQTLIRNKIGLSIKDLMGNKRLTESQREIAFTDKSIQEISFDLGYKDPAYFNRVFKNNVGQTPKDFRKNFDYENRDAFTQNIIELLKTHHEHERSLGFYADKMHVSVKTLSKKVKHKMNTSLGQLIRMELIHTAKTMLLEGEPVNVISQRLNFEEPNHFSRFFKHYVGVSPSDFKNKKYNL